MEPLYAENFVIQETSVDRYNRLRPSALLGIAQEVAGRHCEKSGLGWEEMDRRHLFWAVLRHRVQITRLPRAKEQIRVETWPCPTTRVAFPRSTVAYDAEGNELFRVMSIWVLMDTDTRAMILPGKSGVEVTGLSRGNELAAPGSLVPKPLANAQSRTVRYCELDRNGHMNNTRHMDWVDDLTPSEFHAVNAPAEFTICYQSEVREGETLELDWEVQDGPCLRVDALRKEAVEAGKREHVFSVKMLFA